ncbi:MAG: ral secretion pathway protein [Verrucomicrobiota bacterium]|jgi:prepilin-type N-terminal cleavage/methylation domain-containing protein
MASSPSRTFLRATYVRIRHAIVLQDCFGETPKPARETRALPGPSASRAFTVVELLIVMAIILILAGLILATSSYVQKKGARSRAEAEIAAMSAALENYKADNGIYPNDADTNALKPNTKGDPTQSEYQKASLALYKLISGDADNDASRIAESKSYFSFKPNQLSPQTQNVAVTSIRDPFGNSYGYSTVKASAPSGTDGYNPTFDLWSTGNTIDTAISPNQSQWIKNW